MSTETLTGQEIKQNSIEKIEAKNNELLSFNEEKLKNLIKDTGELLKIDNYEKKEIIKNLGDEAPKFLEEIKKADTEFKNIMLVYNSEINSISSEKQQEKMKLFFEKLSIFKEKHYSLLEKIDKNDGNWINAGIEATKFNENEHSGFWNTPEAICDGLANGMLTKLNQYQNLFDGGTEGLKKMLDAILENPIGLLKSIWGEIKKELSNILDFDGPTYKIAQTIGKFLVDIILQLISGGAGIVGKIATTINKLIPEGIIKKGLNKVAQISSNIATNSIGINKNLLSPKGMKELGFNGTMKKLGTEAIYYGGATPGIVLLEGKKMINNAKDFNKWAKRINKQLAKEGYKIPLNIKANLKTIDGQTIVQLVRIDKKINSYTGQEALKYLNLIDKGLKSLTRKDFNKLAILTGKTELWNKRIEMYIQETNDINLENFRNSNTFRIFYSDIAKIYKNKKENPIA